MSDESKLLCSWYPPDIVDHEVKYHVEEDDALEDGRFKDEDAVRQWVWEDHELFRHQWEYFQEHLTEVMKERGLDEVALLVHGYRMTWQNLSGHKVIHAETGEELLKEILPDTECYVWVYEGGDDTLDMKVSHHDSPTGELYTIQDVSDEYCTTCEELRDDPGHLISIKENGECLDCLFDEGAYCDWCRGWVECHVLDDEADLFCSSGCEHRMWKHSHVMRLRASTKEWQESLSQ